MFKDFLMIPKVSVMDSISQSRIKYKEDFFHKENIYLMNVIYRGSFGITPGHKPYLCAQERPRINMLAYLTSYFVELLYCNTVTTGAYVHATKSHSSRTSIVIAAAYRIVIPTRNIRC